MALNRNFRTTYYKTLGVPVVQHIVDVEASYLALLAEPVVNKQQLIKLALEIGIAPSFRAVAWKVLCGVLPAYKCLWEMAELERQEMYDDLVEAALVLQLPCKEECRPAVAASCIDDSDATSENHHGESTKHIVRLYHTYRSDVLRAAPLRILYQSDRNIRLDEEGMEAVACTVQTVLPNSVANQFWCFVRIIDVLDEACDMLEAPLVNEALQDLTPVSLEVLFARALDCAKNANRP